MSREDGGGILFAGCQSKLPPSSDRVRCREAGSAASIRSINGTGAGVGVSAAQCSPRYDSAGRRRGGSFGGFVLWKIATSASRSSLRQQILHSVISFLKQRQLLIAKQHGIAGIHHNRRGQCGAAAHETCRRPPAGWASAQINKASKSMRQASSNHRLTRRRAAVFCRLV